MKFQMMPAPTKEMAIGRKMNDFATFSKLLRSASTAISRPKTTEKVLPKMIHIRLLRND